MSNSHQNFSAGSAEVRDMLGSIPELWGKAGPVNLPDAAFDAIAARFTKALEDARITSVAQPTPIYQIMATDDDEGAGKDVWMDVTKEVFDDLKQRNDVRYRILAAQPPAAPVNKKTRCESCNLLEPCHDPRCPNSLSRSSAETGEAMRKARDYIEYALTLHGNDVPGHGLAALAALDKAIASLNEPQGVSVREALADALDSPTVAALFNIFAAGGDTRKSYSQRIAEVLEPRLSLSLSRPERGTE